MLYSMMIGIESPSFEMRDAWEKGIGLKQSWGVECGPRNSPFTHPSVYIACQPPRGQYCIEGCVSGWLRVPTSPPPPTPPQLTPTSRGL